MANALRLGIIGLGTVGTGVIKIVQQNAATLTARCGRPIEITAISARSKNKDRGVDLSSYHWVDDPTELATRDDVDVVVELVGGSEGTAYDVVKASLKNGKHVVTANKALLAHHGRELAELAEKNGGALGYEAAVAGGIPIIKSLKEGVAANNIKAVYGILNGTCNYILTQMRETGRDFQDILKDAQEHGYAEADPTFDIEGIDAAHKLCLLTALAFGVKPDFDALEIQGITNINSTDIRSASELGLRIKLLGIARNINGKILQVLEPCLVDENSALGKVENVFNAVYIEGDHVGNVLLTGRGAGEGPTASAVMADIIDIARGYITPTFGVSHENLDAAKWIDTGEKESSYYLRLTVIDQPGVIADISAILRDLNISIESMIQHGRDPGQAVDIVLTTHETMQKNIRRALEMIEKSKHCTEKPCLMAIEEL